MNGMLVTPRLHHFATSVADLELSATWYREVLGSEEEFRYAIADRGIRVVFLSLEDFRIELFELFGSRDAPADELAFDRYMGVRGRKRIAFAVDDTDATRRELEQRGVEFIIPSLDVPDSGGERSCFFTDPDGAFLELYETVQEHDRPRSGLGQVPA